MVSYHVLLKLSIFVNLKFQKNKTEASAVINLFFKKYINLMLSYFMDFLRYLFLFVFVCGFAAVLLLFLFFSLSFSFLAKILAS